MLDSEKPLVSILIPNYNYSRYLRHCIDSVLAQTYDNIEIIIQDNASTDDSYDILMEYQMKYLHGEVKPYINIGRNRFNLGSDRNSTVCANRMWGDYFMFLSSDDALKPTFVERCVEVLEKYPSVGMVMTHRDEIDENDQIYHTPSFYNKSFVVDGESQAAVFMMAGIAIPSQIMMRKEARVKMMQLRNYQLPTAGDWYNNFLFACVSDIGYIKEALCEYRIHTGSETNESEKRLEGVFEHYILINAFEATARSLNLEKPVKRFPEARKKLGEMCFRYCLKMLINKEIESAEQYLDLVSVFNRGLKDDPRYIELRHLVDLGIGSDMETGIKEFQNKYIVERTVSYDPPDGYIELI